MSTFNFNNNFFRKIHLSNFRLVAAPFWTSEIYGFGNSIRNYGFYPKFLPLCIYTDHSPAFCENPIQAQFIESKSKYFFFHSPENVIRWNNYQSSDKNGYCLYSPFVFYRRVNKIKKSNKAKGTIVFPAHSTESIENLQDFNKYIYYLKKLPKSFYPIVICLHVNDIKKKKYKIFLKHNFKVVTAGDSTDQRFTKNFYNIIRNFKYASSNGIGSYVHYCVELGLPFFFYGPKEKLFNKNDRNFRIGYIKCYTTKRAKKLYKMFSLKKVNKKLKINIKQKNYIYRELGIFDGISRIMMMKILYLSFFKWLFSLNALLHIVLNNILVILIRRTIISIKIFKNKY